MTSEHKRKLTEHLIGYFLQLYSFWLIELPVPAKTMQPQAVKLESLDFIVWAGIVIFTRLFLKVQSPMSQDSNIFLEGHPYANRYSIMFN